MRHLRPVYGKAWQRNNLSEVRALVQLNTSDHQKRRETQFIYTAQRVIMSGISQILVMGNLGEGGSDRDPPSIPHLDFAGRGDHLAQ